MQIKIGSRIFGSLALSAVLAVPAGAFAQQNKAVSDAQVEANVLKAFASDDRLSNQPINTSTVYGTVTLTGSVTNDAARDAAEQIASRTSGVKKVVDQLTVGAAPAQANNDYDPASQNSLPSNGGAIPASQGSVIANSQASAPDSANQPPAYAQQGQYPQGQQGQYPSQQGYPPQQQGYPAQGDPNQQQGYPQQQSYPQQQQVILSSRVSILSSRATRSRVVIRSRVVHRVTVSSLASTRNRASTRRAVIRRHRATILLRRRTAVCTVAIMSASWQPGSRADSLRASRADRSSSFQTALIWPFVSTVGSRAAMLLQGRLSPASFPTTSSRTDRLQFLAVQRSTARSSMRRAQAL